MSCKNRNWSADCIPSMAWLVPERPKTRIGRRPIRMSPDRLWSKIPTLQDCGKICLVTVVPKAKLWPKRMTTPRVLLGVARPEKGSLHRSSLTHLSLSLSVFYTQYAGLQATACSISDTRVDLLGFAIGQVSFKWARRLLLLESSKC